jgi:uncharacterized membrane protein
MGELIKTTAHYTAFFLEGIAVLLIISGAIGSIWIYIKKTLFIKTDYFAITQSRNHLGHILSLSLEFLIGADILKTAISPTWQDIGQLAAIVGIRTILNFFLMKEIKPAGTEQKTDIKKMK